MNNDSISDQGKVKFYENITLDYGAHIIYTYFEEEKYIDNVTSFISTGLDLNHLTVLIESKTRFKAVYSKLLGLGYKKTQLQKIIFIDKEEYFLTEDFNPNESFTRLCATLHKFIDVNAPVRTWGNVLWTDQPSIIRNIVTYEDFVDEIISKQKTLSVCAYNGAILPAYTQINLMKRHKYIMTDSEFFPSNIYKNDATVPIVSLSQNIQESIIQLNKFTRDVKRAEDLEVASLMAQSVSHEVRNPMTTVRGFLQMMQNKAKYKEDERYFHLMINELDRANRIISEFISMSKEKAVKLRKQDLNRVITSIKPLVTKMAEESDKSIVINLTKLPKVPLSKEEIYQLIFNLVENALESMDIYGIVTIETYQKDERAVLAIKDSGKGIPLEVLSKIGTPFLSTKKNGKGLGLATSYAILERHNAEIDVSTGPCGTTISIFFKIK